MSRSRSLVNDMLQHIESYYIIFVYQFAAKATLHGTKFQLIYSAYKNKILNRVTVVTISFNTVKPKGIKRRHQEIHLSVDMAP